MALAERDKKLLIFLCISLFLYGSYMIFTTKIPEYEEIQTKLETINRQIIAGRRREQRIPQLRTEVAELTERLFELERILPNQDVGLNLLTQLEELGRQLDVTFERLAFGREVEHSYYKSLEINMVPKDIDGNPLTLDNVFLLIHALDNFDNLLDITSFNISPANNEKTLFNLRLTANVYMFRQDEFERSYR